MRAACPAHFVLLRTFHNRQPANHEAPAVPQAAAAAAQFIATCAAERKNNNADTDTSSSGTRPK